MRKNSFVEGTIIASVAIIITKILGSLYVIPFYSIIGEQGGSLYSYAYNIYNLFLNISTAGLPIAMSKIISEYNALEKYEAKERAYKIGRNIILFLSIITFFCLFVFAEEIGYLIVGNLKDGNSIKDIGFVIRSVSFCLLIIPFLSVIKGYLQGHKFIAPTSTSQVLEQIVRIFVILLGSYLAINVFNSSISVGVGIAVFGAFVGGLIAYIYLRIKVNKNKKLFNLPKKDETDGIRNKTIVKKILTYAVPLIILNVATNLYSITDLSLVIRGLSYIGYSAHEAETIASIISTWGFKICMIINSIATGLSISLIPHIVSNFVKKETEQANRKFNQAIGIILVVALPLTIGISILSNPIYTLFYGESTYGSIILQYLVFTSLFASLHIVMNMSLQAINKYKMIYVNTLIGFFINVALDIPLILLFDKIGIYPFYGAITADIIGYSISFVIILKLLKKELKFSYIDLLNIIRKIIFPVFLMVIPLLLLNVLLPTYSGRLTQLLIIVLYTVVGGGIYLFLTYKNKILYEVFGETYVNKFTNKLKIFKKRK